MKRRIEEAFARAVTHGLPTPPPLPADPTPADRERQTVMQLAYELAQRQHAWADHVLAGGPDVDGC